MVPEPTAQAVGVGDPQTIRAYTLSSGNVGEEPACGTVLIPAPLSTTTSLAGVFVDQTALQQQALNTVLTGDITTQVASVAASLYATRSASALNGLQSVLTTAVTDYQKQLTLNATKVTDALRAQFTNSGTITGLANSSSDMTQAEALSWTAPAPTISSSPN